jgi:hypothetical protein
MIPYRLSLAGVIIACGLSACATPAPPEPIVRTVEVKVPIPIRCTPSLSPAPAYPDSDTAIASTLDIFQLGQMYRAGRALRIAREAELEAALRGCS